MSDNQGKGWTAEFVARGRTGDMIYHEGDNSIAFNWEIGGTVVFILILPEADTWDEQYPWAAGRRDEISARTANAMAEQKCTDCIAEYDEQYNCYNIKRRRG